MSKRKVLFFHETFPCGGAERVTLDIARYITDFNYEVYVATRTIGEGSTANVILIELPDKKNSQSLLNANFLVERINTLSIDIFVMPILIIPHSEYILSRIHCKFVFALHSSPLWESINDLYWRKKRDEKSFRKRLKWHLITYPKAKWFKVYDRQNLKLHKQIYDKADAYTVLCEGYKKELIKRLKVSPITNKLHVIPNSEKQVGKVSLNKKKQILFVGRMSYEDKQIHRLIKIWELIYKEAPEWELILVGDGVEREQLEEQARRLKLQRISFTGYTTQTDTYYQNASIICLTSNYEGWGLCLTEGQANGVIPIAFDCGAGVREIISPSGVNGILIPPFKIKKYAHKLLTLMKHPEMLKQMQKNVILKSKEYSQGVSEKGWLDLFESL